MKKNHFLHILIALLTLSSCKKNKEYTPILSQTGDFKKTNQLSDKKLKGWHLKDIELDSFPGVSLHRAYDSLLIGKKGKEVVVAILDTKLDIYHEDLKNQLWVNKNEIPNNNIDDDKNGYIDDIHGWNFLGNIKNEDLLYQKYSCLRIVEKYKTYFKTIDTNSLNKKDSVLFIKYEKAKKELNHRLSEKSKDIDYGDMLLNSLTEVKTALLFYFPNGKYTLEDLDSLKKNHSKNKQLQGYILRASNFIKYGYTLKRVKDYKNSVITKYEKMLNTTFNERKIQGDDPNNIKDAYYGNNILHGDVPFKHSVGVTGLLAATRNKIGIDGFSNSIKIMPIVMVASGDEHDKDIALAIRYAVDNGAKIINMSWGKKNSLHNDWVKEAMKYAQEKDVLLVTGSGNDGEDNDITKNYPDDNIKGSEFLSNFISVGATTYQLNNKLKASFSNYGKENVDIFAPGADLYTTATNNTYEFGSGTSYASPIVSGIAALIKSYYPNLRASQIKKIILDSGVEYNIKVSYQEKKELIPFSDFSKSGKIVNAYNALIMAEKTARTN